MKYKLSHSISFAILAALSWSTIPLISRPAFGDEMASMINELENVLNQSKSSSKTFNDLFTSKQVSKIKNRHRHLLQKFPNTNWKIETSSKLDEGKVIIYTVLQGNQAQYNLEAKQKILLEITAGKITNQSLLESQSIINSNNKNIPIRISIPQVVLTGSKYNADIILVKPLGDRIVAGGLIRIDADELEQNANPNIEISELGGGGIFKSIQAPLKPGIETLAALIVHPEGIISITHQVRVVSKEEELKLHQI